MTEITDAGGLEDWLKGKPAEFACVLAARAALRAAPVLSHALAGDAKTRRREIVLPCFGALAAASFEGAWPGRAGEIRRVARESARDARDASAAAAVDTQIGIVDMRDAAPEAHQTIWGMEADSRSLGIAEHAVRAAVHAAQAVVDCVDARKGIASRDAVLESATSAAVSAHDAVDRIHGNAGFLDAEDEDAHVAPHVAEIWRALEQDARFLDEGMDRSGDPAQVVVGLTERELWPGDIPVWAGRQWADFKDDLPEAEGWSDWVAWYEARLTGSPVDGATEFDRIMRSHAGRGQAPGHHSEGVGEATNERHPLTASKAESANAREESERRFYTDNDLGSYITASELKRLPRNEQIAHMVIWFRRMYEDPHNQTPYDSEDGKYFYAWGGPFEARNELGDEFGDLVSEEVIEAAVSEVERDGTFEWAPTDANPKNTGGQDDHEEDDEELTPTTLDEIRERLSSGVPPQFGDADEIASRKALRSEIAELREMLESTPPQQPGIGHNQPPEPLTLSVEVKAEVTIAVKEIDAELTKPSVDVDVVVERSGVLERALGWARQIANKFVDAAVLEAVTAAVTFAGIVVWENIGRVYEAAVRWLDAVTAPF